MVGMKAQFTFHARRKSAAVAFKLFFSFMPNSMALHTGPSNCEILTIRAIKHNILYVPSFQSLLVAPGKFNRLIFAVLRTSRSSKNVFTVGLPLHLYLVYLKKWKDKSYSTKAGAI